MSELQVQPTDDQTVDDQTVDVSMPRDEAAALLLALDALEPLISRIRAEIAPPPEPDPAPAVVPYAGPDHDDALHRATWLARESLREARNALGERGPSAEQRRAWQEAARRYVSATRRSVTSRQH
jgi:hypothetical protein